MGDLSVPLRRIGGMSASTCEQIAEALGSLESHSDRLCELTFEAPDTAGLLGIIEGVHRVVRKLRVPGHAVINQLTTDATNEELGGTLGQALADRLRISKADGDRLMPKSPTWARAAH